jgi:hypothetical protein
MFQMSDLPGLFQYFRYCTATREQWEKQIKQFWSPLRARILATTSQNWSQVQYLPAWIQLCSTIGNDQVGLAALQAQIIQECHMLVWLLATDGEWMWKSGKRMWLNVRWVLWPPEELGPSPYLYRNPRFVLDLQRQPWYQEYVD